MKKFKFRLERVLQYRDVVKDEKKRELLLRNQELFQSEERLQELEMSFEKNELEGGEISEGLVSLRALYAQRLKSEMARQKEVIEECRRKVEEAQAIYMEAAKDAKALHTLKGKQLEAYNERILHEEGKFLDELTVQKGNTFTKEES